MVLPFEGIKVVEVAQFAAGPMAGRFLADWGAEVIHIEHPVRGDAQRATQSWAGLGASTPSKINYVWDNINRNKKSVTLDLSHKRGREILYKWMEGVDVFVTNMRLPDVRRFGLEYETLSRLNPRLIYACATGYGRKGPDRDSPGYDASSYFARSGTSHMLRSLEPGIPPPSSRPALGDFPTGMTLAFGIAVALFTRERTGIGQEVEVSLFNTAVYALSYDIQETLTTGHECEIHRRNDVLNPLQNFYQTKDGRWIRLSVVQPDLYWSRFCKALERQDLEHDPRFELFEPRMQNHATLIKILDEVFASRTLDQWKPRLAKEVPWSPCQSLLEVVSDPQARANDFFVTFNHPELGPVELVACPIKLSKTPATIRSLGPEFSEHTEEVLLKLGYTWEDIKRFKEECVIA